MREPRRPGSGQNSATFLALFGLLAMAAALLVLVAMVMPAALGIVGVLFAIVFVGAFHYLAWGWWLSKLRPPADDDEP